MEDVIAAAKAMQMKPETVFGDMANLRGWNELQAAEQVLGVQPVIKTKAQWAASQKAMAKMYDPLKALIDATDESLKIHR